MRPFYIKQLQICNFGRIENECIIFSPGFNMIKHDYKDEIKVAARFLIDAFRFSESVSDFVGPATKISGEIILGSKIYHVLREPIRKNSKRLNKKVLLVKGSDFSNEKQSGEEQGLSVFNDASIDYSSKLMKYKNEDKFYQPDELSRLTNKLSDTDFFRRQTREYINDFIPTRLWNDKDLIFDIDRDGSFYVRRSDSKEHMEGLLSTTESKIYSLLCFINILKFWQKINEIRDFNHYDDPVIISDCLSQIDEAVSIDNLVSEFKKLKRQVILF